VAIRVGLRYTSYFSNGYSFLILNFSAKAFLSSTCEKTEENKKYRNNESRKKGSNKRT
jgi:hypothetical protein